MKSQQAETYREPTSTDRVLLSVRGLCMSFDGQQVLNGVDLDLHEGQVVLLRGPNGSGKTTLVNILTGYLIPDKGEIRLLANGAEEKFVFPRRWWQNLNPWDHFLPERVAREGICRSWQETRLFSSVRLVDNVAVSDSKNTAESPINVLFCPGRSRRAATATELKARETLAGLGLNNRGDSSADKISLGQAKRVAIARATATGARILFLDEPLAGLDGSGIRSVVDLLKDLVDQHRMALVLVEHVSSVHHLLPLVDTIWDLSEGRLRDIRRANSSYTDLPAGTNIGLQQLISNMVLVSSRALPAGATLDIYRSKDRGTAKPVLEAKNLVVHRGRRLVIGANNEECKGVSGINMTLCAGDLAILQAPNGWGKTTFLDCIAGLRSHSSGDLTLCNTDISKSPPWDRRTMGIHYLRSDKKDFPSLNVSEIHRVSGIVSVDPQYLSKQHRKTGALSGGERQTLLLNRLQYVKGLLWLLDEPFSALDQVRLQHAVVRILGAINDGQTILLSIPQSVN